MRVRSLVAAAVAVTLLLPCLAQAQATQRSKKRGGKKAAAAKVTAAWLLPDLQPAPSAKELAKQFPGADAVVVLDAIQHEWVEDHQLTRVQRRVRFLTDTGARKHGRLDIFVPQTAGPWGARDGSARLLAADGSATPLTSLRTEAVDGGLLISVEAPGAASGDLLEVTQELESGRPSYPPWTAQGELPVLESRIIAIPPPVVTVRAYGTGLPTEALEPTAFDHGDLQAAGWRFTGLGALPSSAFSPPREEASGRLLLAIETYPDRETGEPLELDWAAWGSITARAVAAWTEPEVASSLSAEWDAAASPADMLSALGRRLEVTRSAPWPEHDSARAALESGSGTSADLALLAAAALQAAGVKDVELIAARPRARGPVASVAPVDGNFTELLVRVGELWLGGGKGGGVGALPPRLHGTLHATLGPDLEGPVAFPAITSANNRREVQASLTLSSDGHLSGASTWTRSPLRAAIDGSRGTNVESAVDKPGWGRRDGATMEFGALPWRLLQDLDLSGTPPAGLIDLGHPRTDVDVIAVELPKGVTGAKLCSPANIDAGPAGSYLRTVKPDGRTVTVTRTFRLDVTRFGPDEAEALFTWLRRIQQAEQAVTKLQLE